MSQISRTDTGYRSGTLILEAAPSSFTARVREHGQRGQYPDTPGQHHGHDHRHMRGAKHRRGADMADRIVCGFGRDRPA